MDIRKRITQKLIHDSFIELITDKNINKITVTELCAHAKINRSTFYLHYLDIYDLYAQFEKKFVDELINIIANADENGTINFEKSMEFYCNYFIENKLHFEILHGSNGMKTLGKNIYDAMKKETDTFPYRNLFYYNNNFEKYASLNFFVNGSLAVISETFLENTSINIKQLAKTLIKINHHGIRPKNIN